MRLGSHITAQIDPAQKCKTCYILGTLTDEDREDFAAAVGTCSLVSIADGINSMMVELEREDRVGRSAVGTHISKGHKL